MNKRKVTIDTLNSIKKSVENNDNAYKLGIDLTNFDSELTANCVNVLSLLTNIPVDEINWWLFEDVKKIYYVTNKDGTKEHFDVSSPEKFYDYYFNS